MPQLIYSPWAKFCGKGNDPGAKEVCFTGKDARTEAGQPVVAAALIEPEGEPKKLFRVTLPSPLQLQYGTRIIIDKDPAISGAFFTCFANGCMADYEATPELVGKLKKGQTLVIQAINLAATAISFPLPLADTSGNSFQKANEGPPPTPRCSRNSRRSCRKICRSAPTNCARSSRATRHRSSWERGRPARSCPSGGQRSKKRAGRPRSDLGVSQTRQRKRSDRREIIDSGQAWRY